MKNKKSSQVFETYTGYYGVADEEQKKKSFRAVSKIVFWEILQKG